MRNSAWNDLAAMSEGKKLNYLPAGFLIDSPWIPGWYGISIVDYFSSDELWQKANIKVVETFPDVWFFPGFWSEYGMCTEPSAFGSKMVYLEKGLPYAEKILTDVEQANDLAQPNVKTDGMLPFMLNRLKKSEHVIRDADHQIRFAVARGPLNIATFLMGATEFFMALAMNPDGTHRFLKKISDFLSDWISLQKETFPSIEGILILDDMIGFIGEADFNEFVTPYLTKIYKCFDAKVRFLHNDAEGLITAKHLNELGVNMFNFSFDHSLGTIRELAGPDVILVGNIPPRDVMAEGTPGQVRAAVQKAFGETDDYSRILWSAGGGIPPGVSTENFLAFIDEIKSKII